MITTNYRLGRGATYGLSRFLQVFIDGMGAGCRYLSHSFTFSHTDIDILQIEIQKHSQALVAMS